ncbi:hypothetical protein BKA90DRAFT_135012, partial [Yarrowia lipolytica]
MNIVVWREANLRLRSLAWAKLRRLLCLQVRHCGISCWLVPVVALGQTSPISGTTFLGLWSFWAFELDFGPSRRINLGDGRFRCMSIRIDLAEAALDDHVNPLGSALVCFDLSCLVLSCHVMSVSQWTSTVLLLYGISVYWVSEMSPAADVDFCVCPQCDESVM